MIDERARRKISKLEQRVAYLEKLICDMDRDEEE